MRRQNTTSNAPSGRPGSEVLPTEFVIVAAPGLAGVDFATSICSGAMSRPSTLLALPMRAAIHRETVPVPQPMSAARCLGDAGRL